MKHMTISPSASTFFHNEEAAPVGKALQAVNLRRRCKSVEVARLFHLTLVLFSNCLNK